MKSERHNKIMEIIQREDIETQEELARRLQLEGFKVTQATVSRDIREMNLSKIPGENGRQKYGMLRETLADNNDRYLRMFRDGVVNLVTAQNILVIKTVSGMAMAVAASVDAMNYPEIAGCIAGDDVVMCVAWDAEQAIAAKKKITGEIRL